MIVIFILGQWAVVQFGTHMRAAPDLSGTWELIPNPPNAPIPGSKMVVRQSGRFAEITIEGGPHFSAKLQDESGLPNSPFDRRFASKTVSLAFSSKDGPDTRSYVLEGDNPIPFVGKRVTDKR